MRQDDVGRDVEGLSRLEPMISERAARYIRDNFKEGAVVCLSGAGISVESGIPAFRGEGGLWEKYDPDIYANAEGLTGLLRRQPAKLADFIAGFYTLLIKARPTPAHQALAALERQGILRAVITQNIDNLHQQAGSRNVVELHGNAFRVRCPGCLKKITLEKERIKEMTELLKRNNSYARMLRIFSRYFPRCECGGRFRTDIVLFRELLPQEELALAYRYLDTCRLLLLVGTSLTVIPASGLPLYAKKNGSQLLEINQEETQFSQFCDLSLKGKADEILPEILDVLGYA